LSSSSIQLNWNSVSGAASYTVYRSNQATGAYEPVIVTAIMPYRDTGLVPSTTYYYNVSGVNSNVREGNRRLFQERPWRRKSRILPRLLPCLASPGALMQ
jgi:hypothetical protein